MKKKSHRISGKVLLTAMVFTATIGNAQTFTKITDSPITNTPGDSRSVNWADLNNDGLPDLFISNGKAGGQNNMLYLNQGSGLFGAVAADPIVLDNKPSDGATFADCDNDGDLDAFIANWYNEDNLFYANDGLGSFAQITGPVTVSGGYSETAAWGDYDNDGLLDLYVTRSGPTTATRRNQLYHNDGNNIFTKIQVGEQVTNAFLSRSVNWTDIDNDGDLDLFVTNENNTNENIYRNDGLGVFEKILTGDLVNNAGSTMSSSWADYDNDGDLDVYLANDQSDNALFRNDGNFTFTKITEDPVSNTDAHSFSSAWGDIDNDGDLDLFVTNAFGTPDKQLNFLYTNNNGSFTKVDTGAPATDLSWSYGCAFGDYDNDGFLDLAVATVAFDGVDDPDFLYHNDGNDNNWLTVKLVGTITNKSAIGTKIRVKAAINGTVVWQMREVSAQSSYCGQNDLRAHFGLGDAAIVETITVEWLSGLEETFENIGNNQFLTIVEGAGILSVDAITNASFYIYPNPVKDKIYLNIGNGLEAQSFSIYTISGKLVMAETDVRQLSNIDVSNLDTGNYFIKITYGKGTSTLKFIKE